MLDPVTSSIYIVITTDGGVVWRIHTETKVEPHLYTDCFLTGTQTIQWWEGGFNSCTFCLIFPAYHDVSKGFPILLHSSVASSFYCGLVLPCSTILLLHTPRSPPDGYSSCSQVGAVMNKIVRNCVAGVPFGACVFFISVNTKEHYCRIGEQVHTSSRRKGARSFLHSNKRGRKVPRFTSSLLFGVFSLF